jgi:hypothetical protein
MPTIVRIRFDTGAFRLLPRMRRKVSGSCDRKIYPRTAGLLYPLHKDDRQISHATAVDRRLVHLSNPAEAGD